MKAKPPPVADPSQAQLFPVADEGGGIEADVEDARVGDGADAPGLADALVAVHTAAPSTERESLGASALLATLADWAERGWIRRLDAALARFVNEHCAGMTAPALLAVAMAAHMEGRGHACVAIDELVMAPEALLAWKPEAVVAFAAVMAALPRDAAQWIAELDRCSAVDSTDTALAAAHPLVFAQTSARPLVLVRRRLYLRRYWDYERRVADRVRERATFTQPVDEPVSREWLARLFPERAGAGAIDWQKVACAIALRGRFAVITGGPGTGKTYTAARLLALLFGLATDRERFRVALAAPTGKAAARLKQSIDGALAGLQQQLGERLPLQGFAATLGAATTLHALLGARPDTRRFRHDAAHPLELDVLVVDEASMVDLEMMAALLDALPAHARVVLLGDKDQLASVEAGAVLGELCRDAERGRYTGETARYVAATTNEVLPAHELDASGAALAQRTVMLRESQRFGGVIGTLARAVNAGDVGAASAGLHEARDGPVCWMASASIADVVELAARGRPGAPGGHRRYLEALRQRPAANRNDRSDDTDAWARQVLSAFDTFRVLCAVRDGDWGVAGFNRAIEQRLRDDGWLPGSAEWYEGRPVMVTRNDRTLGVYNGDIGIVLRPMANEPALRAYFTDGAAVRSVAVSRLADVETAFAMTVHKSQGSEFDHTVLVLPPEAGNVTSRELIYTGITRARSALTLVSKNAAALADGIARSARRSSGLHELLQPAGLDGSD